MKSLFVLLALFVLSQFAPEANAQGGIGNQPREDLVMLRAAVQDSFAREAFAKIMDLKRYTAANQADSAALVIAHNGGAAKSEKWARAVSLTTADEKTHADELIAKLNKLFTEFPEQEKLYYAVFKDKDNPAGQKHFLKVNFKSGKKVRAVSFTLYPVGEQLLLGEVY